MSITALASPSSPAPLPTATRSHLRRSGSLRVPVPLERALELFTPLGEKLWAPGWEPEIHYPADGAAKPGTAWTTRDEDGVATHWVLIDWNPERSRVRYSRVTPGLRAGTVEVLCRRGSESSTAVDVTYELTALSDAGDADLAAWTESWYAEYLMSWESSIVEALASSGARR